MKSSETDKVFLKKRFIQMFNEKNYALLDAS